MKKSKRFVKKILSVILIAAMVIPMLSAVPTGNMAQAKANGIEYRNNVFSKKLYKDTKKISFVSDSSMTAKDRQTIKKIYRLLAGMELEVDKNADGLIKNDCVDLVINKKNGVKRTYTFKGDLMYTGNKAYKIKKNPINQIRNIYDSLTSGAVVKAAYPKMAKYPNEADYTNDKGEFDEAAYYKAYDEWWEDTRSRRQPEGYADGLDQFLTESARQFLSGSSEKNMIYSPLNVYMALGMLAELTDGNSRQQILDLLGSKDINSLRSQASDLWNANYKDDGMVTSILASSLWLNQDIKFNQSTLNLLAAKYLASTYQGEMGSDSFNKELQNWLNEQTGGLLKEQASSVELSPDTILALATTIYYRARWHDEFWEENTKEDVFHAKGQDETCEFLNKQKSYETYYMGDKFSAVAQSLQGSGSMWFLLPNEGVTVDELLNDKQAVKFLVSKDRQKQVEKKNAYVNLSVPKFDAASQFGLKDGLKALGVTDVFDENVSDFSPMTELEGLYVSKADHAARVAIDEEGVTAAAYTVIGVDAAGAMVTEEEIDFIVDRPFLFAVTGSDGLPLFAGVVNQP